jgi:hypothetical protein
MGMATQAQCEKAVTIPEPKGRARKGVRSFQEYQSLLAAEKVGRANRVLSCLAIPACRVVCIVFNDLRAGLAFRWKRSSDLFQYLPNRAFVLLQGGWFGPNFVTIFAEGVRVCSY